MKAIRVGFFWMMIYFWLPLLINTPAAHSQIWMESQPPLLLPDNTTSYGNDGWDDRFFRSGPNSGIDALATDGENVYAAGRFTLIDGIPTHPIARWDGERWHPMGEIGGIVRALLVDSKGILYAAVQDGGSSVHYVKWWDGQTWRVLGERFYGVITALAISPDGEIYAAGFFKYVGEARFNRVARWDGENWRSLGEGVDGVVRTLAADRQGNLYVGGDFDWANGNVRIYGGLAIWDGSQWRSLSDTEPEQWWSVRSLATTDDGGLYVGGSFTNAWGVPVSNLAYWDGKQWRNPGIDLPNSVQALYWSEGELFVFGAPNVYHWDGSQWNAISMGASTGPFAVHAFLMHKGQLYVGGGFFEVGQNAGIQFIARWDGSQWYPVYNQTRIGNGIRGRVNVVISDRLGNVYVGGNFANVGVQNIHAVAQWNGQSWLSLDNGLEVDPNSSEKGVVALAVDKNGVLYACEKYHLEGCGVLVEDRWERITRHPGNALTVDQEGNLYISYKEMPYGKYIVIMWDGSEITTLGMFTNGVINALTVADDGALYVGGQFQLPDTQVTHTVARWDGQQWHPVGNPFDGPVYALVTNGNKIYAGGQFTKAGDVTLNHIAYWNGEQWLALATGIGATPGESAKVTSLALYDGMLFVGGRFGRAGSTLANNVALWNGSRWYALGDGVDDEVAAMAIVNGRELYVVGRYLRWAGNKSSLGIAMWHITPPPELTETLWFPRQMHLHWE